MESNGRRQEFLKATLSLAVLGSLLMAPEACSRYSKPTAESKQAATQGAPAPDFTAKNLDGKDVKLSDFRGKVVLVNFWAVWCGPCNVEVPELVDLYNMYRDKGFVVLGISDNSDLKDIKSFVTEKRMGYPIVIDPGEISDEYNVTGFPTSFLLDRNGNIVQEYPGYSPSLMKKVALQIQKLI
ncbi:MAG: TlpA disulfide reductase family protein [Acidobacteriia bacterium]|nr:TlpA disulfide reductase family protein [Terriglobia bacterium]